MAVDVSARSIGLLGWCVIAVVAATLAVLGRMGRAGIPAPAAVMREILRMPFGRLALLTGWLILGWHLFLAPPGG
ncbi:MAG: hypothetical protein H0V95_11755 [Actinobacteria bacterium]|nr:hypothetical protein [Actinomycetota bacterium]